MVNSREFLAYVKNVFPYANVTLADPSFDNISVFVNISDVGMAPASKFAMQLARDLGFEGYKVIEKDKRVGMPYGLTGEWDYTVYTLQNEQESFVYIHGIGTSEQASLIVTLVE